MIRSAVRYSAGETPLVDAAGSIQWGTRREQPKQAGNAVTPPMARDLGYAVAEHLLGEDLELAA